MPPGSAVRRLVLRPLLLMLVIWLAGGALVGTLLRFSDAPIPLEQLPRVSATWALGMWLVFSLLYLLGLGIALFVARRRARR